MIGVQVIANDGEADSLSFQKAQQFELSSFNPTISISSTSPTAGTEDIICSIDFKATDIDGDSLSYIVEWQLDGQSNNQVR